MTLRFIVAGFLFAIFMPQVLQGQSEAVQQLYQKAHREQEADHLDAAIADYRGLIRLDPTIAPAYNNLGRLFYNGGRFAEAVTVLRKGLTIDPIMAPANVMLGASLLQLGQLEGAVEPLQAGIDALPNDRFALITLTRVLLGLNRPSDALPYLERIKAMNARDQEAWYLLGKVHLELSQQAFAQVQSIDVDSPLAHEMSGEIMESMQNTPGAIEAYKQAIVAAPDSVSPLVHLSNLYWSTGDWEHAREYLTLLLAKQPGNCLARWKMANTLDEMAEPAEQALTEINRSLESCPELPQAHAERARLLLRLKRPAEAITDLAIAEKSAPDEASIQRLFAQAYSRLGDKTRADAANLRFQQLEAAQHAEKERHAARIIEANQ